jgi:hypothetical protein
MSGHEGYTMATSAATTPRLLIPYLATPATPKLRHVHTPARACVRAWVLEILEQLFRRCHCGATSYSARGSTA